MSKCGFEFLPHEPSAFAAQKKMPPHLAGLAKCFDGVIITDTDEKEYAEIAFLLASLEDGDRAAIKKISEYIQAQHRENKMLAERFEMFVKGVSDWMDWARFWTVQSDKPVSEESISQQCGKQF